eukprot:scaffold587_cov339-Pavlova_lutheri.AAC.70
MCVGLIRRPRPSVRCNPRTVPYRPLRLGGFRDGSRTDGLPPCYKEIHAGSTPLEGWLLPVGGWFPFSWGENDSSGI